MSRSHPAHIHAHKHTPRGLVRSNIGFLARCPPTRADFPSQSIKSFPRVARIQRYHGTGVPNSSNSHYCPGLNLTPGGNNIQPIENCNFVAWSKIRKFVSTKQIFLRNFITWYTLWFLFYDCQLKNTTRISKLTKKKEININNCCLTLSYN